MRQLWEGIHGVYYVHGNTGDNLSLTKKCKAGHYLLAQTKTRMRVWKVKPNCWTSWDNSKYHLLFSQSLRITLGIHSNQDLCLHFIRISIGLSGYWLYQDLETKWINLLVLKYKRKANQTLRNNQHYFNFKISLFYLCILSLINAKQLNLMPHCG